MHELSLCAAIAEIATDRAAGRAVDAVHVRVGQLRQVVPDTLTFCWEMITIETGLAGSALRVERVAAVLRCPACGWSGELGAALALACQRCGAIGVEVLAGDEFDVVALDLARAVTS